MKLGLHALPLVNRSTEVQILSSATVSCSNSLENGRHVRVLLVMRLHGCELTVHPSRELASAVAVPQPDNHVPAVSSPEERLKRRNSSASDTEAKRRRLDAGEEGDNDNTRGAESSQQPPSEEQDEQQRRRNRRGDRNAEERKRGQRLFGALLGTLSQQFSTATQKRRADIEQRQQEKLKMQDAEYDEQKRKRREELTAMRKKQQRAWEREAVCSVRFSIGE